MIRIVNEESTAVITMTFLDFEGEPMTPVTRAWQLQKKDGTIINSRTFAAGSFSGTTVALSGDDLALDSTNDIVRIFAVQGTYNHALGDGLTFTEEIEFNIRNLYSQS